MTVVLWHLGILAVAVTLAVVIVRRIPVVSSRPPAPPQATRAAEAADRAFAAVRWWEHRLASTRDDLPRFHSLVQRRLAELVVERLRRRHGTTGPARAAEILGAELHELITVPLTAVPTRAELARLIARIEEI
ncbi:hypothetical protein [Streptosporangium lutulentum]|uniref:Uncharacterized protein n=1 Tax=Streptosporangium lutulentum TaxID=1461250 RepID=A0ABT9QBX9_9ACTN|nr:hypothetical protein [Streptosporangium lutulentum]MDP9844285.1 hypothetical protein [Streptosporangium lutulentum]